MMAKEQVLIEIGADGALKVEVKGRKGRRCLEVRDLIAEVLGPVESTTHTAEFYEPEEAHITAVDTVKNRTR